MNMFALYVAAAATTTIAGLLHLMLGPNSLNFNVNQGILFIVGGIAQVFWIIPMIRRWGIPWYAIGIAGTIVFMALWIITRIPDNPITGRGGPADNPIAITIEVFQAAFIGLAAAIIVYEYRKKMKKEQQLQHGETKREVEESTTKSSTDIRHMPVLGGIVIALILIGLFALPMVMPSPMGGGGGPPGQGGGGPPGQGGGGPPGQGGGGTPPPSGAGQLEAPQGQAPTQEGAMDRGNST
jgi:hypothetical protein